MAGGRIHHRAYGLTQARWIEGRCPRVSAPGKTGAVGIMSVLALQSDKQKFLRKVLHRLRTPAHIRADETALFRSERRISKTICNAIVHNAGFNRHAALHCQAACDPEKNLFPGAADAQTNGYHVCATACRLSVGCRRRDSTLRVQPRQCAVAVATNARDYVSGKCRFTLRPDT